MIVSLISGGSGYLRGANALGVSLGDHEPTVPRLLLIEEGSYSQEQLATINGWTLQIVPPIRPLTPTYNTPRWARTFTKVHVWNIDSPRVIYLDADCFVVKPFYNNLINRSIDGIGACWVKRDSNRFNSGVMIVDTNPDLFQQMQDDIKNKPMSVTHSQLGDQGYLNTLFKDWTQIPDKYNYRTWKREPGDLHIAHLRPHPWQHKSVPPPQRKVVRLWNEALTR